MPRNAISCLIEEEAKDNFNKINNNKYKEFNNKYKKFKNFS